MPKGLEATGVPAGGLAEGANSGGSPRLGHEYAHGRSYEIGRVGRFILWCLGRRPKRFDPEPDAERDAEPEEDRR